MHMERMCHAVLACFPSARTGIPVDQLVDRESDIGQGGAIQLVLCVLIDHLVKDFNAHAVAIELAGTKKVAPERTAILERPIIVGVGGKFLIRNDVSSLPEGHLLC